ncbi:hypothetical protein JTE90_018692 [Oedothorax gibbosus]|uniref:Uncharacterized protein n=1 Tax=Oedothorax gibbosus TaxID=931172 RepID=A0AAV6V1Z7_9ARAC|nr:hypothetical protein JTE90_018692 [Oedothorax gibbosus]
MDIEQILKIVLPNASAELLSAILTKLQELGVVSVEDLVYVRETDLASVVLPIQARKLVEHFKSTDNEHSHKSYMVAVDKKVVNETTPTFERAFYMLFASFFVFNIEYTETACSTLEFVQRCFLNINPDKGTKRG